MPQPTIPQESLLPRRTVKQAQEERSQAKGAHESSSTEAEAKWATGHGMEAPEPEETGFSTLLKGLQTVEDYEDRQAEEQGEEDETPEREYVFGEGEESLEPEEERKPATKRRRPPQRVRRAIRALKAARIPENIIRQTDPEDLVEWALELREEQGPPEDRRLAEATRETPVAKASQETGRDRGEHASPEVSLDLAGKMKAFADKVGISEDEAGATLGPLLGEVARQAAAAAVQNLRPEMDRLGAHDQESEAVRDRRTIEENLERLTSFHPDLEDDVLARDELVEKAIGYWKGLGGTVYDSPDEAFDDAFRATLGPMEAPEKKVAAKRRRARRNGRATIPRGQTTARQSLNYEDYEKQVFLAGQQGANFEQLKKIRKPSRKSTRKEKASRIF